MTMFDEDDLADLISAVRSHSYDNFIEKKADQNIIESLGVECKDLEKFDLTPIDKKKLKKMRIEAVKMLYEDEE